MAAYSGLWNGVHGVPHALTAKVPALAHGLVRMLMRKRGLYGFVRATGEDAPTTIKQVQAARATMVFRGGYDYTNRVNDVANTVSVPNIGNGAVNVLANSVEVPTMSAGDLTDIANTVLKEAYVADEAATGVTSPAQTGARSA